MSLPGEKARLLNFLDNVRADDLQTLYNIEVVYELSRIKKRPCGAVVVFKLNEVEMDLTKVDASPGAQQEVQDELNKQTEVMYQDPIYFHAEEEKCLQHAGGMIGWALDQALGLFDKFGTNADLAIKSKTLGISHKLSRSEVLAGRENPKTLFRTAFDIEKLLMMGFRYDVYTKDIHRGMTILEKLVPLKDK